MRLKRPCLICKIPSLSHPLSIQNHKSPKSNSNISSISIHIQDLKTADSISSLQDSHYSPPPPSLSLLNRLTS